jgi:hypothetical protein
MDQPIIRSSEVLVHMRAMMMMLFLDFHISIIYYYMMIHPHAIQ